MPIKGMKSLCFHSKTQSLHISCDSVSNPRRSFSDSTVSQIVETAAQSIMKWNPEETSPYAKVTSLFYENKREAQNFIKCVNDLQKTMHFMVSEDSTSEILVHAQNLMLIAMKRLQKEFYQTLSMNRAHLDPESVSTRSSRTSARSSISNYDDDSGATDDEIRAAGDSISEVEQVSSIAMSDLRSIAECMISSGYAKECVNIYKSVRKSIIDEGIYRLGVEKLSSSHINKMEWEVLEILIKNWLEAMTIAMKTLFNGERILCDHVFAFSDSIRESCFSDIAKEGAQLLFQFPEILAKSKRSPEKMFRVLDMYNSISILLPEIESIFSFESTSLVRVQALTSLVRLGESVRAMLSDFQAKIHKDSSKSPVHGGGVHRLTIDVMNYISLFADYSIVLVDIFQDWPPQEKSMSPELYLKSPDTDDSPTSAISRPIAWIILVLLCKLDVKAKHYKDNSLSYLFIANNLQYIISIVRTSNLQYLVGEDWVAKHEDKVKQFATKYEKLAWGKVFSSLPENPTAAIFPEQAKLIFQNFNVNFEETYRTQKRSIVSDAKLRDEIKLSIARKFVPVYKEFYDTHTLDVETERHFRRFVKYTPEDLDNYLSNLFLGTVELTGTSSSLSN